LRRRDFLQSAGATLLTLKALGLPVQPMAPVPIPTVPLSDREVFLRDFGAFVKAAYTDHYGVVMQPYQLKLAASLAPNETETT